MSHKLILLIQLFSGIHISSCNEYTPCNKFISQATKLMKKLISYKNNNSSDKNILFLNWKNKHNINHCHHLKTTKTQKKNIIDKFTKNRIRAPLEQIYHSFFHYTAKYTYIHCKKYSVL